MHNRAIDRRRAPRLAAAVASSAALVACTADRPANAALTIDLRVTSATNGVSISADKKTVDIGGLIGLSTITLAVIARISGTNAVQTVGDFANNGTLTTANDDSLQIDTGSFRSS